MKNICRPLLLVVLFSWCAQVTMAQTDKFLELLNRRGFYRPALQWLEDENHANGYLREMSDFSDQSLRKTLEYIEDELQDVQVILQAREEILGTKLVKKLDGKPKQKDLDEQDEILAKRFNESDRVKEAFEIARRTQTLCHQLKTGITSELAHRTPKVMPQGALTRFFYSKGNGFAGYHHEVTLEKKEGKNILRVDERRMRYEPEEEAHPVYDVVVADSVMNRVRAMVEEGQLYDVGHSYMPDYMIMDASNWSMSFDFEGGSISSSGYASGPDHSDALGMILRYLTAVYEELKPKTP